MTCMKEDGRSVKEVEERGCEDEEWGEDER